MKKILVVFVLLILTNTSYSKNLNSYNDLDLTSKPKKVLSKSKTKALWNVHKKAKECFEHPTYGEGFGYKLTKQKEDYFIKNEWITPFYKLSDEDKHKIGLIRAPKPLEIIKLDENYGEEVAEANFAMKYFQEAAYVGRAGNKEENIDKIKTVLLDWAKKDALRKGINVSWGKKPVDWQMMVLINSILTTTAVIADKLDTEERRILGPWLNNLVKKVAKSRWKDRQDNKAYLTSYITMIWGLMINDLKAIQHSIDVVKLAVNDMRPDGSFPIDTQRSGMGLKYNSDSYGYLLMMASLLKDATGKDLFNYEVDGRSLHNGADFVIQGIMDPSKTNQKYAISCPGAGDRWGSIEKPSTSFVKSSTYLMVYVSKFPDYKNSDIVVKKYNETYNNKYLPKIKSEPSRVFTLHPMLISN
ncbi:alginate lyase family protein [Candidatus Pelagibacter sp. HIMB1587]|uniref:alginate lyase family protein n=1 Tax=unclassified Candidatus Pelagibacter TaxID=2647897 RepID=UPI003F85C7E8